MNAARRVGGSWVFALVTCFVMSVTAQAEIFIAEGDPNVTLEGMLSGSAGIAVDPDGNVFVADTLNHVVRKYLPDGTPLTVFGREFRSGSADGSPAEVRFNLPSRLATAPNGDIIVVDSGSLIRRIDRLTLTTSTIADLRVGVDAAQLLHLLLGQLVDEGVLADLVIGDLCVSNNGDIFVTAANSLGAALYLVRVSNGVKTAIATSKIIAPSAALHGRGVALDRHGNLFAQFPGEPVNSFQPDNIYRFPDAGIQNVTIHFASISANRTMTAGLADRLYLSSGIAAAPIEVISSTQANMLIGNLNVTQTFPALPSQEINDLAIGPQGALYAVNERSIDGIGVPTPPVAKVDRFPGEDVAIGAALGDTILPSGSLIEPVNAQVLTTPLLMQASGSDDSGQLSVQYYVDDAPYGPVLDAPPYEVHLLPSLLRSGNHQVYAMLRDAVGNARATSPVTVLVPDGLRNTEGEILLSDIALEQPVGVATDASGDVYVADRTRISQYSPLGGLLQTYGAATTGTSDGNASQVRFSNLKGLGQSSAGDILIVDDPSYGSPRVRALDPQTGITSTLAVLDAAAAIDVSNVYDVSTGTFQDLVGSNPLCAWIPCDFSVSEAYDLVGTADGGVLIGTAEALGPQLDPFHYVVYLGAGGNRVMARASITYGMSDAARQARGIAVDHAGAFYAAFPAGTIIADHDVMFGFSAGFPAGAGAQPIVGSLPQSRGLLVDGLGRLYVTQDGSGGAASRIDIVSTTALDTLLEVVSGRMLDYLYDIALDDHGNLYVTSSEIQYFSNQPKLLARVTRFGSFLGSTTALDTDADGVPDSDETQYFQTDPNLFDSDRDGIGDGVELGVVGFDANPAARTDPRNPDSDGDGAKDGEEDLDHNGRVDPGESDPADPASTPGGGVQQVPWAPMTVIWLLAVALVWIGIRRGRRA